MDWGKALEQVPAVGGIVQAITTPGAKMQLRMNKLMADYNQQLNEKSAAAAHERAKEMNRIVYEQNSYQNLMKQLEEAGLNKSLATSNGAGGGGGSSTTGAQAGPVGVEPVNLAAIGQTRINSMAMSLQMAKLGAEIDLMKADAEQKRADADSTRGVEGTQGEAIIKRTLEEAQRAFQEGRKTWLENNLEEFIREISTSDTGITQSSKNKHYGESYISGESIRILRDRQDNLESIKRTDMYEAQAFLSTEQGRTQWGLLQAAITNADANATRAAAQELATKFQTGELTNWKTWVDIGLSTLSAVGGAIGNARGLGGSGTTTKETATTISPSEYIKEVYNASGEITRTELTRGSGSSNHTITSSNRQ